MHQASATTDALALSMKEGGEEATARRTMSRFDNHEEAKKGLEEDQLRSHQRRVRPTSPA